jgi:DNA-directed RNA polymerase specialized sigma24 family protein
VTARTTPSQLRGDEAELYQRHHRALVRAVARVVDPPRELIEDACQDAWDMLLRRQPERTSIFAWLRVVAVHEAYLLCAAAQRETHLEDFDHGDG